MTADTPRRTPARRYLFDNAALHLHLLARTPDPHTRHVLADLAPRAAAGTLNAGTIAHFIARGDGGRQVAVVDATA